MVAAMLSRLLWGRSLSYAMVTGECSYPHRMLLVSEKVFKDAFAYSRRVEKMRVALIGRVHEIYEHASHMSGKI